MKKKNQSGKKLSLKKVQLSKLNNLSAIKGGSGTALQVALDTCLDPENGSKPIEMTLGTMR